MSEVNSFVDPNAGTDGSSLLDMIGGVASQWDDQEVSSHERYCSLQGDEYDLLVHNQTLLNRDFGGETVSVEESVIRAYGVELVKVSHLKVVTDGTRILAALWQDPLRVLRRQLAEAEREVKRIRGTIARVQ